MKGKWYPYYKDSGIAWLGEIPRHWETKALKRVFKTLNGSTPKSSEPEYWDGDIPWATPDDLGSLKGHRLDGTQRMITKAGYESCGASIAPKGSLILSTRAPIGHLAIAGRALCTNQGCRSLVFRRNDDTSYFYYQLLSSRSELESWGQGSTFKELGRNKLESIYLVYPPISEQSVIAKSLDRETERIDTLIAKKERQIELLQEKRIALISHAVTKGIDPNATMKDSGIEWMGNIPEHWAVRKLKYVARANFSSVDKHTFEDELSVRLCNYVDVYYNDHITSGLEFMEATATPEEVRRFTIKKGDVLVTKDSEEWDDIAVPAYVAEQIEGVLCGYHLAHIRAYPDWMDGNYLFCAFAARGINDQFRVEASGVTRYGLSKYALDNALFPVPPVKEQVTITAFLDRETTRIDGLIKRVEESIAMLREYRAALISAMVTGKIDVRKEVA